MNTTTRRRDPVAAAEARALLQEVRRCRDGLRLDTYQHSILRQRGWSRGRVDRALRILHEDGLVELDARHGTVTVRATGGDA